MKRKVKPYAPIEGSITELLNDPEVRMLYEERKAKERLAVTIKQLREGAHLTQSQLALKAGTTQAVIARIESAKDTRTTSMPLLAHIASACGRGLEIVFPSKTNA